jgi:hypothetical protein
MKKIYYVVSIFIVLILVIVGINLKFNSMDNVSVNLGTQKVWGEPVLGDLNGDGQPDKAVWLIDEPGGSGTFFYAQLLINNNGKYVPTDTMFLGDRIAPQNINIQDGRAVYNFAERGALEPMTTPPSLGKSVWVNYDQKTNQIGEWVKGFEGESNL